MPLDTSLTYAKSLDEKDPLAHMRQHFSIPKQDNGEHEYSDISCHK